ncbi:GGDEF domain-containing protein [Deinococcus taeanensis]|uniref:diguanylate cyclase n=1 Tax=Deinococcus taeanensis TaxID=2737050 RepID=UPI001CDC32A8|nr:diguanylate cyclase [Deinococcus taeanensis]UBV41666.1 GGDEF domain-containing protein [Deinococcus taeanensis]
MNRHAMTFSLVPAQGDGPDSALQARLHAAYDLLGSAPQDALAEAQAALSEAQERNLPAAEARALRIVGLAHHLLAQFELALDHLQRGRQQYRLLRNAAGEADCLNNIGSIFFALGNYSTAMESYLETLTIREELGDEAGQASALNNLGNVALELGDAAGALAHHERSLHLAERSGRQDVKAAALCNLGSDYQALGQVPRAIEAHRRAISFAREIRDGHCEAEALANLGRTYHDSGQPSRALTPYTRALKVTGRMGDRARAVDVRLAQARAYQALGQLDVAAALLDGTLRDATALNARKAMYQVHETLAEIAESTGDAVKALAHYRQYHALEREVLSRDVDYRVRSLMLHYDVEKRRKAHELLRAAHEEKAQLLEQLQVQSAELDRLAHEDPLTGLMNRRSFELRFAQACAEASTTGAALSVVMIDVDHFKSINDAYGHDVGDEVLRGVAGSLAGVCRSSDLIARYGGEEFVMVLPGTPPATACSVAQRLLTVLSLQHWDALAPDTRVSVSCGVAGFAPGHTPQSLLRQADERLYDAKQRGRARVES